MQSETSVSPFMDKALKMIEASGGVAAMHEGLEAYEAIWMRMQRERDALIEEYPDKWAAMGKDGLVAVGDSLDDIIEKVDALGVDMDEVVLDHLEVDPTPLIL